MRYIKAESLKCRHTMINYLLLIAPAVTVFFSLLAGGLNIFQSVGMYWWYMFILQGMIAILCFLAIRIEQASGNERLVYSLPVDLRRIKYSKNLMIAEKLLAAHIVLAVLLMVIPIMLFPDAIRYTFGQLLLGNVVIVLTSMWQIPFCFLLMHKLGILIPIVLNTFMGLITIVFLGNTPFGYIWPYCWPAIEMEKFLSINLNGVPENQAESIGLGNVIIILMAVVLFMVMTKLDARLFEKGRE